MKELKTLLGGLPNSEAQLLVWGELLKATLAGDGATFGQLVAALPGSNKGSVWRTLKKLEGMRLAEGISVPTSGCDRATPEVAVEQPDSRVFRATKAREIIDIFSGLASLVGEASCSSATKNETLSYNIKESLSKNSSFTENSPPQDSPAALPQNPSLQKGSPVALQLGTIFSEWFKEIDYKRLERRLPPNPKDFGRVARLEQACFNAMFGGYYRTYGADPFLRTIGFCEQYARFWGEYLPAIPCTGEKALLGKKFTDSQHWKDLVEARRQADRHNAKYDEWCRAIFKHYKEEPLPHRATPTPKYFKTPKAAEHYAGYYADLYLGGTRDLNNPIWSKEEHDLTCPVQLTAYQNLGEELKVIARQNNRPPYQLFEEAIRSGAIPIDYVKKHYKTFANQLDLDSAGEIKKSLVEEMGL